MGYNQNIVAYFLASANQHPNKLALIEPLRQVTFGELKLFVEQKAGYFKQKGIQKNDRVLVFVPMSIDLYVTVLALFYIGAVAVFLDEWVTKKRMELCCQIADCKGFIAPLKLRFLALLSKEIRRIPIWLNAKPQKTEPKAIVPETTTADDTALITFTTGSTGIPKAANRTHGFLNEQFTALVNEIKPQPTDIGLPVLPVVLLINLGAGCTSVISGFRSSKPHKTNFARITESIHKHSISRIECSPDFILRLAQHLQQHKINLPSVQKIFTGGAPVFPSQASVIQHAFSQASINIVYGSTEAEPISLILAQSLVQQKDFLAKGLPVGTIYSGAQVRIIPITSQPLSYPSQEALEKTTLKPNEVGEIIVSGHHVLRSYINNPEAILQNKIVMGDVCWHRTGDSGFLDANGHLFLCGRANQIIYTPHQLILPFIVENMILETGITTLGTVLKVKQKVVLIGEGSAETQQKLNLWAVQIQLPVDETRMVKQIPRDKRHHSKIDYPALMRLLEN